jgi:hypothetical protein
VLIGDHPGTAKAMLLARASGLPVRMPEDVLQRIDWNRRLRRRWQRCWHEGRVWG